MTSQTSQESIECQTPQTRGNVSITAYIVYRVSQTKSKHLVCKWKNNATQKSFRKYTTLITVEVTITMERASSCRSRKRKKP